MEIAAILKLATVAIELIIQKDKTKGDRLLEEKRDLETEWYAEFNRPENERSNLTLDLIRRKLLILADTIHSSAKQLSGS